MAGKLGQIGALASFDLVAGDRFELRVGGVADGVVRLELPRSFVGLGDQPQIVEDAAKRLVKATLSDDGSALMIEPSPKGGLLEGSVEAVWLEYVSANRYRLVVKRGSPPVENEIIGGPVRDGLAWPMDAEDARLVSQPPKCRNLIEFQLGLQAARLATQPGFDQLISLPMVHEMEVLEHQTRTAVTVLRRMRGRAMLCDEVGLGKTVEAGLILSELLMRGLARSVLILTPPSLMAQWQGEMRRKFGIELTSHDEPGFRDAGAAAWGKFDRVIASIHTAKREPHRGAILGRKWDIVIVDEAHHLRNRTTEIWKFASEIEKQFILLLTATPVQNNLEELFNLVTLLEPGLLSTRKDFCRRFVAKGDKMTPTNVGDLHALLAEVMVRNKRNNVGLEFTRRFARTELVSLDDGERALYDAVAELVREGLKKEKKSTDLNRMTLLTLQMALGSSAAAAAGVLGNLGEKADTTGRAEKEIEGFAESYGGPSRRRSEGGAPAAASGGIPGQAGGIHAVSSDTGDVARRHLKRGHRGCHVSWRIVADGKGGGDRAVSRVGARISLHRVGKRGPEPSVRARAVQF